MSFIKGKPKINVSESCCEESNGFGGEFRYLNNPGAYHSLQGDISPNIGQGGVGNLSLSAHLIKPNSDFEVSSISINIISNTTPGNSVVAIYDLDSSGYPSTKLLQTSEFNNLVTGIQTIATKSYTLKGGKNYAVVFQSSDPISNIRRFAYGGSNNTLIWGGDGGLSIYGLLVVTNTYSSTFPDTFPVGGTLNTTAQIAVYFQ